jgi:2'-5' RNA ligase
MRCFVAVDIPEELKSRIVSMQEEFSSLGVKLVEPENLHFTLKFLGEIDDVQIKEVEQDLSAVAKTFSPFSALLSGIGAFPSLSYIRVVWVGSVSNDFINLHKAVAHALRNIGSPEKDLVPHLTISRVRSAQDKEVIAKIIKRYEKESFGSMQVDRIKLKKSTLTPRGPIYEDIMSFELSKSV